MQAVELVETRASGFVPVATCCYCVGRKATNHVALHLTGRLDTAEEAAAAAAAAMEEEATEGACTPGLQKRARFRLNAMVQKALCVCVHRCTSAASSAAKEPALIILCTQPCSEQLWWAVATGLTGTGEHAAAWH